MRKELEEKCDQLENQREEIRVRELELEQRIRTQMDEFQGIRQLEIDQLRDHLVLLNHPFLLEIYFDITFDFLG